MRLSSSGTLPRDPITSGSGDLSLAGRESPFGPGAPPGEKSGLTGGSNCLTSTNLERKTNLEKWGRGQEPYPGREEGGPQGGNGGPKVMRRGAGASKILVFINDGKFDDYSSRHSIQLL